MIWGEMKVDLKFSLRNDASSNGPKGPRLQTQIPKRYALLMIES